MMRFWALGDMHGNGRGLQAALEVVDAQPRDALLLMGDLLTYGADVARVVDLVAERVNAGARLLLGNHDQLYLELLSGRSDYYDTMADWIQESADLTLRQLPASGFAELPFETTVTLDDVFFAHANPFGDWSYLNSLADMQRASNVLAEDGFNVGVFGHTHRSRIVTFPEGEGWDDDARRTFTGSAEVAMLLNTGSVGQPRNRKAAATLLSVDRARQMAVHVHDLQWDRVGHLEALRAMPVSDATKQRLCRFFEPHS